MGDRWGSNILFNAIKSDLGKVENQFSAHKFKPDDINNITHVSVVVGVVDCGGVWVCGGGGVVHGFLILSY